MILDKIVELKEAYLKNQKNLIPYDEVRRSAENNNRKVKNFQDAIKNYEDISIIAEIKCASPSKGMIRENFNHIEIAEEYLKSDIQAMSILTETDFFLGAPKYLKEISEFSTVPLLRKDFIIDDYQIYEAYNLGADAILLIAAILDVKTLIEFKEKAHSLNMKCLTEVHNEEEIKKVINCGFEIIGINNRNLTTFNEDIHTTERLRKYVPNNKVLVSESSIKNSEDLKYLKNIGADAVLIGETFMRSQNIESAVNEIRGNL